MTTSSQPPDLSQYLAGRGFAPNPANPAWLDLSTGQQIVRVLHEPGEATLLYCLDRHGVCLYEAVFSPGTPDAVLTAVIEAATGAALGQPRAAGPAPGRPQAGRRTREGRR